MRTRLFSLFLALATLLPFLSFISAEAQRPRARAAVDQSTIPSPRDVLGFTPGEDRKLASWNQVISYFEKLDKASDRVTFEALGKTTMDVPFVMATISAPENLTKLNEYRRVQELLADPRKLGAPNERERKVAELISRGKSIVLITCGIHSTEVGSYLSSMLIAHRLASSNEPEIQEILKNTIILLVPSLNPDGVDIVKNWYDKTLGTPYEGTSPPELYHKYVGHDNNRDWYAFTQVETKITVDKIHNVWRPHIVHDIHQQGEFGARLFLPPYMAPVEPNVPSQIVAGYTELGNFMASEMRRAGFNGITTNSSYDAWTPARAYSHYHGGVRILSETASARIATPTKRKLEDLRAADGYDPKVESAKFGPIWRGGDWRLSDITNYMTTGAFTLLKHASQNREQWLRRFYEIGSEAVRPRRRGELSAYTIEAVGPGSDRLMDIFDRAGVEYTITDRGYFINLAQPYGAFAKALLEVQRYPNLLDDQGHPIPPYDVTAHTLSMLFGVKATPVNSPYRPQRNQRRSALKEQNKCVELKKRNALYQSSVPSMDEGWTRWIFDVERDRRCVGYSTLRDSEVRAGKLNAKYDSIVLPDMAGSVREPRPILNGYRAGAMPPEYTGGIGIEGVAALREFVERGGTLVCLNRASEFAIEQFKLPVRNVVDGVSEKEFFVPGSILRIELDMSHPMSKGMDRDSIAWVEDSPVFEILPSGGGSELAHASAPNIKVVARYPVNKNPLLSGWLLGADRLKGKAALVEVGLGKGRIILFGFRPQYRGQSLATYPLFFNAISGN
ncbi:MAG TPA: M14 family metallopeptidase [Pyrinomonadaceae bacterium]|nr:M14 family metallopeptidase [Pyrinomonadaceae bacterium]